MVIIGFAVYYWIKPPPAYSESQCLTCQNYSLPSEGCMGFIADTMNYFLPDFLNGLITKIVIQNPWCFWGTALLLVFYWGLRVFLKERTEQASEEQRNNILSSLQLPVRHDEVKE
ncbi:hypothetical protein [Candidatus Scalindua japonica]|uniref:hypothetical protein n=1 Tax=Candidatus Scalindua japonica TaxID=1284222 RepID=UPI000BDE85AE|nr:hypothetical protein [Candidatus Scalindua japonica]